MKELKNLTLDERDQVDNLYRALNTALYDLEKAKDRVAHLQGWVKSYKLGGPLPEDWQL